MGLKTFILDGYPNKNSLAVKLYRLRSLFARRCNEVHHLFAQAG
jgi:hypothetical protein